MALLDTLKEKALDAVNDEERHKEWVEKGFDEAVTRARGLLPAGDEPEIKSLRETGEYALDRLEKHKDDMVELGADGLRSTIGLLGLGQYNEAARHAALLQLRESGSWDDVNAAILGTAQDGNQAKRDREAQVARFYSVLKDIGVTAGKALLPLLLAL